MAVDKAIVRDNNAFAVELYRQLSRTEGNLFFSPESVAKVLSIAYAGARGETAQEMARALHFTLPQEQVPAAMAALSRALNGGTKGNYQLSTADGTWIQQGFSLLPEFLKQVKGDDGAALNQVDFGDPEKVRALINQWVEKQTANKITNLFGQGVLTSSTRMVLANAIYFKGDWDTQFTASRTTETDFHVASGRTVRAMLMERTGSFPMFNGGSFGALEIPYKGKDLSMIIFLPTAIDGLPQFERSMTPVQMEEWLSHLQPQSKSRVELALPRYKMTAQFGLGKKLSEMGMRCAFDPGKADFSGINGKRNLSIGAVVHKAYVEVNEQGTEAAAATGMAVTFASLTIEPKFRADHPFVFLIRDNRSGVILFMGRVANPLA